MKILHSAFFIFASLREIFYPEKMNIGTEYIAFIEKEGLLWLRKKNIFQSTVLLPLRYNNDKRKKPLFSRGLSVCRHLFNSFSKLKCDEKIIEKRRLFH